jgi:hypothetical protein
MFYKIDDIYYYSVNLIQTQYFNTFHPNQLLSYHYSAALALKDPISSPFFSYVNLYKGFLNPKFPTLDACI